MPKVTLDNLSTVISSTLSAYSREIQAGVAKEVKTTAKHCRDTIKQNAPVRTGAYQKSWSVKNEQSPESAVSIVYAKKPGAQLGHLLEYGHQIPSGGRVPAKPHIAPAANAAEKELTARVETVIRNTGTS